MNELANNLQQLPKNWIYTTLGEICKSVTKIDPHQEPNKKFKYIEIASIDNSTQRIVKVTTCLGKDAPSRARQLVKANDILFSTVRTYLKNLAMVSAELDNEVASTGFCVIRPHQFIDKRLIFYLVQSNSFLNSLTKLQRGTSYPAVRDSDVFAQVVPLPPFNEQSRIVGKVEELFSFLDAGVASLRAVQAQLKRYRQAVLKAAFEGKLTQQWRTAHKEVEPAQRLIEYIKQERQKDAKYVVNVLIKEEQQFEVPDNWAWSTLGELFYVGSGGTPSRKKREYWNGNIPWVSSGEVAFCEIKKTKECITQEGLENSSAKMYPPGTVLIALYGEGKTRGQVAMLRINATTNQAVACITCQNSPIASEYVYWWLFYRYLETRRIKEGANQPNMYLHHIKKMPIPVSPLLEQKEIVTHIAESLSFIQEISNNVNANLLKSQNLRQCILKEAFTGKLVAQDPIDESADKLLERIKTECLRNKPKSNQVELSKYVK